MLTGIDCLQVLQHASGKQKYLSVRTQMSHWMIGSDIDGRWDGWIRSASAGSGCPASPANKNNERDKETSWQYNADGKYNWRNAEIVITCATHC